MHIQRRPILPIQNKTKINIELGEAKRFYIECGNIIVEDYE
jgi:hypothetical protein